MSKDFIDWSKIVSIRKTGPDHYLKVYGEFGPSYMYSYSECINMKSTDSLSLLWKWYCKIIDQTINYYTPEQYKRSKLFI